mmetsp:Transcript_52958/g.106283  ORF Transcript_52958/g.106283 Transcript_52958/m.106283 type:complete len:263 (-) Transcript_52958:431-1219(-)
MRTVPSNDTVSNCAMLSEKEALLKGLVCPLRTCKHSPEGMLHTRAVVSMDALTARRPSGEKAACVTTSRCPLSATTRSPVFAAHRQAVPSMLAVTMNSLLGDIQADFTSAECPVKARKHSPVSALHMRASPSLDAPTIRSPSAENSPEKTCPDRWHDGLPVSVHQTTPSLLEDIVRRLEPLGESSAESTGPEAVTNVSLHSPLCRSHIRTVPSKDAVRQTNGMRTRKTASLSAIPAAARLVCLSSTCERKTKCMATPASPVS